MGENLKSIYMKSIYTILRVWSCFSSAGKAQKYSTTHPIGLKPGSSSAP